MNDRRRRRSRKIQEAVAEKDVLLPEKVRRILGTAWAPLVSLLLLAVIYFAQFVFTNDLIRGLDTGEEYHRGKEPFLEKVGELAPAVWSQHLGGTPVFRYPQYFPLYVINLFTTAHRYLGWRYFFGMVFGGVFMYLCMRGWGLRRLSAWFSGLMYACMPTLMTFVYPGQEAKMLVIGLFPLMVWSMLRAFETRRPFYAIVLGLAIASGIYTAHLQMLYYALLGLGVVMATRLVQVARSSNQRRTLLPGSTIVIGGLCLGLLIGAVSSFPAYWYTKTESRRAGEDGKGLDLSYAQSWSLHPEEIVSLLVPEFVHHYKPGEGENLYWGRNPLKLNAEYVGLVPLFFAILALGALRRDQRIVPLFALGIFALLFSLGPHTPLHAVFYRFVPGMNVLRVPGMIAYLFAFPIVAMAGISIDGFLRGKPTVRLATVYRVGGGLALLLAAMAVTPAGVLGFWKSWVWTDIPADKLETARANLPFLAKGALLGLLWIACLVVLVVKRTSGSLSGPLFVCAMLPIALIDTWRVDKQFLVYVDPANYPDPKIQYASTRAFLHQHLGMQRIWLLAKGVDLEGIDQVTVPYHDPFVMQRYDNATQPEWMTRKPVLDVLNTRYVVSPGQLENLPEGSVPEPYRRIFAKLERATVSDRLFIYENPDALPWFYLRSDYVEVADEDAALRALASGRVDPSQAVILEQDPGFPPSSQIAPSGTVSLMNYEERSGIVDFQVELQRPAVLVVSQNYSRRWHAVVDRQDAELLRANYVWQGVVLGPGTHTVSLRYKDTFLTACMWISLVSSIGALFGLALTYRRERLLQGLAGT